MQASYSFPVPDCNAFPCQHKARLPLELGVKPEQKTTHFTRQVQMEAKGASWVFASMILHWKRVCHEKNHFALCCRGQQAI